MTSPPPVPTPKLAERRHFVIEMRRVAFAPRSLAMPAAEVVAVLLENKSKRMHNRTLEEKPRRKPRISVDVEPGGFSPVNFALDKGGKRDYRFVCKYHPELGMTGSFVPEPGSPAPSGGTSS